MIEDSNSNKFKAPWRDSANSLLIVLTILAAMSGVILTIVLQDDKNFHQFWLVIILLLAISFWLFVSTSERITDALDEDDVEKYISLFIPYNFAAISLFTGTFLAIYSRTKLGELISPNCLCFRILFCAAILLIFNWRWIKHIRDLFRMSTHEYDDYKDELLGVKSGGPTPDRGWGYALFIWLRNLIKRGK